MNTSQLLSIVPMLVMLLWAAIVDAQTRRIKNWLTASMMLSGFLHTFFAGSLISPAGSLFGFTIGFALALPLFVLGAVGGGDVKLLAAVGTWLGAIATFKIFCAQAVIGMVIILIQSAAQGRLTLLARNTATLAVNLAHLNEVGLEHMTLTGQSCRSVDRPLPFAVPVLLAVTGMLFLSL